MYCKLGLREWLWEADSGAASSAYTCSHMFCPRASLRYEHMFSSLRRTLLAQRTLGALDLARSFLMLEDDDPVDWEVGWDEQITPVHPHRAPLRRQSAARRPAAPSPAAHECMSPTFYGQPARRGNTRAARRDRVPACRLSPVTGDGWRAGGTETPPARRRQDRPAGSDCRRDGGEGPGLA